MDLPLLCTSLVGRNERIVIKMLCANLRIENYNKNGAFWLNIYIRIGKFINNNSLFQYLGSILGIYA